MDGLNFGYAQQMVGVLDAASRANQAYVRNIGNSVGQLVQGVADDARTYKQALRLRETEISFLRAVDQKMKANGVPEGLAKFGITDPSTAIALPIRGGDNAQYMNRVNATISGMADTMVNSGLFTKDELVQLAGLATPSAQKPIAAGVQKYATEEKYKTAGRQLGGIDNTGEPAVPATQLGALGPQPTGGVAGPTTQIGPTANPNPTVRLTEHLQEPQTQFGQGQMAQGGETQFGREQRYAKALELTGDPEVAKVYADLSAEGSTPKTDLEWAKLALRKRDLTQKDARISQGYFELAVRDAWNRAGQWGENIDVVDKYLRPRLDEIRAKRIEIQTAPDPIGAPEDVQKIRDERKATADELQKQELDLVKLIGNRQQRATWTNIPTGETGQARLYDAPQLSNRGYGGSAEPQGGGPAAPESTPEWMGPDVGTLPGGNASSMGTRTERSSSVSAEVSRPAPKKKPSAKPKTPPKSVPAGADTTLTPAGTQGTPYTVIGPDGKVDPKLWAQVPSGALFRHPDGSIRRKP